MAPTLTMRPPPACIEIGQRRLTGGDGGSQIDSVHEVPRVESAAGKLFPTESAGDVDQAIEAAGLLDDPLHRRSRGVLLRQIDAAIVQRTGRLRRRGRLRVFEQRQPARRSRSRSQPRPDPERRRFR